jgi:hypothetical protein
MSTAGRLGVASAALGALRVLPPGGVDRAGRT